ncbi:MAG: hypothetical protein A3I21_01985, partial [Candidatus Zambryskibacteria bacterium RIFCSPLOWO2_02_FULL_39_69]
QKGFLLSILYDMQITQTQKIITSTIVVVVLLGLYIYIDQKSKQQNQFTNTNISTSTEKTATTTIFGTQVNTTNNVSYTIEQVPIKKKSGIPQPIPDLNRPATSENILTLQAQLKKNPADFPAWLDLAMYQKMAGDYQGSVISWTYAGKLMPSNPVSFGNLGNLYAYFLHDKTKAEMYYKQAISKGPTQIYLYGQLVEVYLDIFHDTNKARAIIDQGLLKMPNDPNLLQMKAGLSASAN